MDVNEKKSIFREKSLDRISSPEELDQYIRVAPLSVWLLITGIAILLVGIVIWGIFGNIDSRVNVVVKAENGQTVCYIEESYKYIVKPGMPLHIDGDAAEYVLGECDNTDVYLTGKDDNILVHMLNLTKKDYDKNENNEDVWAFTAKVDASLTDGMYEAYIVTDEVAPAVYITN